MNKLAIRLLTLAMLSLTLAAAPVVTAVYAAPDNDPPPPDKKKKKSSEARPGSEQTAFADGYRAAYAAIYERHDYAAAIAQLKALGRDDSAAVANLIGYSYRQPGTSARSRPIRTTSRPGSITASGRSNRATAIRRSIT